MKIILLNLVQYSSDKEILSSKVHISFLLYRILRNIPSIQSFRPYFKLFNNYGQRIESQGAIQYLSPRLCRATDKYSLDVAVHSNQLLITRPLYSVAHIYPFKYFMRSRYTISSAFPQSTKPVQFIVTFMRLLQVMVAIFS